MHCSIKFVLCFVLAALLGISPTFAADDKAYVEDVKSKLANASQSLISENFQQATPQQIDVLKRGQSKRFRLQLNAGTTYGVVGACDQDCTHVAISLRDDNNRVLVQSREQHHTAIVSGTPEQSALYTLYVSAPGCSQDACYIGLAVLQRSTPPASNRTEANPYPGIFLPVVSSLKSYSNAVELASEVHSKAGPMLANRAVKIRKEDLGVKGVYYRVVIEPASSRSKAEALCKYLQGIGFNDCFLVSED